MTLLEAAVAILILPVSSLVLGFWVLYSGRKITKKANSR